MNTLQVHKYYWHRDGASNYMLYLTDLLEKDGHKVIPFSVQNSSNLSSKYDRFFVSQMDLDNPKKVNLWNKIKYTTRMFYSFEAKRKIRELLKTEKIDVVHLHNIYHHISPSILGEIKKRGIKIVMTLHDYKLICPNYTMFHHGKIHEEDCKNWYFSCLKNKCHKNSYLQSLILVKEMIFHHKIIKFYEKYVDKFIAPSEFIMNKCIENGWPKEKFVHVPHPIDLEKYKMNNGDKGYVAYAGRLSEEKGLEVLLEVAKLLPEIKFKIAGTGPIETSLKSKVKSQKIDNVDFVGFKSGKDLENFLQNARMMVVPSVWYENYPLSVLEPMAMGKIVIGSKIGGISEMLPDELLCTPNDVESLVKVIEKWYRAEAKKRNEMGEKLRKMALVVNNPEKHLKRIFQIYQS